MIFDRETVSPSVPVPADMFQTTRNSKAGAWGTAAPIAELNTSDADESPWLSTDGRRIVFSSNRGASSAIYEAIRSDRTATFSAAVLLEMLDSADSDVWPTLSADGLEIFFASDRPGVGGYDVYRSTRPTVDQSFAVPTLVPELSSTGDDGALRLSPDGLTMYLNYNADVSGGTTDLAAAVRPCRP